MINKLAKKPSSTAPRPRRTNKERSATTRSKLIDAAIEILYRLGYSACTTIEVAKKARVSRGAMLHQFPTRVDMLLAVARHIAEVNSRFRREQLGTEPGLQRFNASADVNWNLHSQPSAIALLEIIMATRSDRALGKGSAPFAKMWTEGRQRAANRMAADLNVSNVAELETMVMLHQAALRGLAIELMLTRDVEGVERARQMLVNNDRLFSERLMSEAKNSR